MFVGERCFSCLVSVVPFVGSDQNVSSVNCMLIVVLICVSTRAADLNDAPVRHLGLGGAFWRGFALCSFSFINKRFSKVQEKSCS